MISAKVISVKDSVCCALVETNHIGDLFLTVQKCNDGGSLCVHLDYKAAEELENLLGTMKYLLKEQE